MQHQLVKKQADASGLNLLNHLAHARHVCKLQQPQVALRLTAQKTRRFQ